jgi:hypothetical protein
MATDTDLLSRVLGKRAPEDARELAEMRAEFVRLATDALDRTGYESWMDGDLVAATNYLMWLSAQAAIWREIDARRAGLDFVDGRLRFVPLGSNRAFFPTVPVVEEAERIVPVYPVSGDRWRRQPKPRAVWHYIVGAKTSNEHRVTTACRAEILSDDRAERSAAKPGDGVCRKCVEMLDRIGLK